ncbi:MAG: exopolyphosphatase [Weeksellaceae bacterium]|nr:exopolyphosphatase [Weeksellaceae bacterium]
MKITKLAAIDVGSNAVRLLINTIYDDGVSHPVYNKTSLVRIPVRLGVDAFVHRTVSADNIQRLTKAMQAYRHIMDIHGIQDYRAFATSAMREVTNGDKVIKSIKKNANIDLEIIDGQHEADVIFATELDYFVKDDQNYLFVDVGGGSTELTLLAHGKVLNSKSFPVGTVRWLHNKVPENFISREIQPWILENTKHLSNIAIIGSGGNINFIFKLSAKKMGKPLTYNFLKTFKNKLSKLTYEQRMSTYNMKPDRADVVMPALEIFTQIMRYSKATKIYVPKIGLADGMIQYMYHQMQESEDFYKEDTKPDNQN